MFDGASIQQRLEAKGRRLAPDAIALCLKLLVVQPLSVVDKSNFSPSRLTFPLDGPYSSFSEGNRPFTSFQAKRISS